MSADGALEGRCLSGGVLIALRVSSYRLSDWAERAFSELRFRLPNGNHRAFRWDKNLCNWPRNVCGLGSLPDGSLRRSSPADCLSNPRRSRRVGIFVRIILTAAFASYEFYPFLSKIDLSRSRSRPYRPIAAGIGKVGGKICCIRSLLPASRPGCTSRNSVGLGWTIPSGFLGSWSNPRM